MGWWTVTLAHCAHYAHSLCGREGVREDRITILGRAPELRPEVWDTWNKKC